MIVGCPSCRKKNRISLSKLPATGQCGACGEPFGNLAAPIDADTRTFDEIVRTSSLPVLVDFWAPWCGPCKRAAPEVARAAAELAGRAIVVKVDTQANPDVSQRLGIKGIPYFAVFKDGHKVVDQTGLMDARGLSALVARAG